MVVNSTVNPIFGSGTNGTSTTGGTIEHNDPSTGSAESSTGGTNIAAAAGGAAAGAVTLFLLGLLIWFLLRRRRIRESNCEGYEVPMDLTGEEVKPYIQPTDGRHSYALAAADFSREHSPTLDSDSNVVCTLQDHPISRRGPFLKAIAPSPASDATSYPPGINSPFYVGIPKSTDNNAFTGSSPKSPSTGRIPWIQTRVALPVPGISSVGTVSTDLSSRTHTEPASAATLSPSSKSPGVTVPSSPHPTRSPTNNASLNRMRREGRETDMGPIVVAEDFGRDDDILPPDYQQATEPLPGPNAHSAGTI